MLAGVRLAAGRPLLHVCGNFYPRAGWLLLSPLTALRQYARPVMNSDPDPDEEDQHSSDDHLKCSAEKWRIHIPFDQLMTKSSIATITTAMAVAVEIWNQIGVKCDRFLLPWSLTADIPRAAKVCRGRSDCRHQKQPQRTPLKFLLQGWQRDRPPAAWLWVATLPQNRSKVETEPSISPRARLHDGRTNNRRWAFSSWAQLLESGIRVEISAKVIRRPPPPSLPVVALTRR
jgi:hypothetical protein